MNPLDLNGRFSFPNQTESHYREEQTWATQRHDSGDRADDNDDDGYDIRQGIDLSYQYSNEYNGYNDND